MNYARKDYQKSFMRCNETIASFHKLIVGKFDINNLEYIVIMIASKFIPTCETCAFYMKRPNDVPRCKLFRTTEQLTRHVSYLEIEVARFDDFELCRSNARYFIKQDKKN